MNNKTASLKFIIFCLEHYKFSRQISAMQALADFKENGVFNYLTNGYDVLHTQGKNYLMNDIQDFINNHKQQ
jgi:hypothetical protein